MLMICCDRESGHSQEPCPCPPKPAFCHQELIWSGPASSGQPLLPGRCVGVTVPAQTASFPRPARHYHVPDMASGSAGTACGKAGERIWAPRSQNSCGESSRAPCGNRLPVKPNHQILSCTRSSPEREDTLSSLLSGQRLGTARDLLGRLHSSQLKSLPAVFHRAPLFVTFGIQRHFLSYSSPLSPPAQRLLFKARATFEFWTQTPLRTLCGSPASFATCPFFLHPWCPELILGTIPPFSALPDGQKHTGLCF